MAIAYEARLLEGFNPQERQELGLAMKRLLLRALEIGPLEDSPKTHAPSSVRTE